MKRGGGGVARGVDQIDPSEKTMFKIPSLIRVKKEWKGLSSRCFAGLNLSAVLRYSV